MHRLCRRLGLLALLAATAFAPARAWNDHALSTWQALAPLPELATLRVRSESLERFVTAQGPQLERVLAEHEAWARTHITDYAPRPDEMAFKAGAGGATAAADGADARRRFLRALRLNPSARLPLFLQLRPGEAPAGRPLLPWSEVTTLASGVGARQATFVTLAEGAEVPALEVVATASHEPDYGLDLGLFTDSGTEHGRQYGFGKLPFGNPQLEYATQAPFHMGLYHESRIIFMAAAFLRRTQPEARIALFSALARHALDSGHAYWGWRFAGWAMHYLQDLTQPYHAQILPGVSAPRMLGINAAAMAGWRRPMASAITLVSNRHGVVESWQRLRMVRAYETGQTDDPLFMALRDARRDRAHWRYGPASTREVVSRESAEASAALDEQLERSFPAQYTGDPTVELGTRTEGIDWIDIALKHSSTEAAGLERQVAALLQRLGVHSRALVRALLNKERP